MTEDERISGNSDDVATIPLLEERLIVGKREVERGRIKIRVDVEQREEVVVQDLLRDDVLIERVPKNERLSDIPHVRLEGDVTVIPVVEEVVIVEKALMLVEEIHVQRRAGTERREIPVIVRSEQAVVERASAGAQSIASEQGERHASDR